MATLTLTAEELLRACLDADSPETPLSSEHGAPGSAAARFRECSAQFLRWLASDEGAGAATDADGLWRQMFEHVARAHIEHLTAEGALEDAAQFSAACQAVCARLMTLRESLADSASWQDIIIAPPKPITHSATAEGAPDVTVTATLGCLRRRADGEADMVEHCLGPAEASESDVIRFAIIAWLWKQSSHSPQLHGVLEGYAPEMDDVLMSAVVAEPTRLDEVFSANVRPVLQRLGGVKSPEGPDSPLQERPTS